MADTIGISYMDTPEDCIAIEHHPGHDSIPDDYFTVKLGTQLTLFFDAPRLALLRLRIETAIAGSQPGMQPAPTPERLNETRQTCAECWSSAFGQRLGDDDTRICHIECDCDCHDIENMPEVQF